MLEPGQRNRAQKMKKMVMNRILTSWGELFRIKWRKFREKSSDPVLDQNHQNLMEQGSPAGSFRSGPEPGHVLQQIHRDPVTSSGPDPEPSQRNQLVQQDPIRTRTLRFSLITQKPGLRTALNMRPADDSGSLVQTQWSGAGLRGSAASVSPG